MRLRLPFALFAAALTACVSPPPRLDPFAGLDQAAATAAAAPPSFSNLALGLVVSQNTRNALDYMRSDYGQVGDQNHARPIEDLLGTLKREFKSVARYERLEDAQAAGVDVVGILDFYAKLPHTIISTCQMDETVLFLEPSGQALEKVSVSDAAKVNAVTPFDFDARKRFLKTVMIVESRLGKRFAAKLTASEPLRILAARKSGAPAPAPAAAAPAPQAEALGRSDVDEPTYKAAEDTTKFALVVGVEKYENLPPAEYAERDAAAVRRHLLALGYPERNVLYLTGSKAGRAGLEKYVESWLPRNVDEHSQVFVYFSGHGAPDPRSGQAYLVPWDGDAQYLENTAYPIKRLYERLGALKAKRIVVALDACFSGAGGRSVLAKGARPLVVRSETERPPERLSVLAASAGEEITGSAEGEGHGLFTYYLLKGLNERRGAAQIKPLYDFLKPKVQDAARRQNRDQTPQFIGVDAAVKL